MQSRFSLSVYDWTLPNDWPNLCVYSTCNRPLVWMNTNLIFYLLTWLLSFSLLPSLRPCARTAHVWAQDERGMKERESGGRGRICLVMLHNWHDKTNRQSAPCLNHPLVRPVSAVSVCVCVHRHLQSSSPPSSCVECASFKARRLHSDQPKFSIHPTTWQTIGFTVITSHRMVKQCFDSSANTGSSLHIPHWTSLNDLFGPYGATHTCN